MLPVRYDAKAVQRAINNKFASCDLATLTVVTGSAGSDPTYDPVTNTLTIPPSSSGSESASQTMTAQEILTSLLTVDGASSNLDADKLDGNDSSYFLNTSSEINAGSF